MALNLMDDIVTGKRSPADARAYYATEFLDYRRKQPTPYMDGLRFTPGGPDEAGDPDEAVLSDEDLARAQQEGEATSS